MLTLQRNSDDVATFTVDNPRQNPVLLRRDYIRHHARGKLAHSQSRCEC